MIVPVALATGAFYLQENAKQRDNKIAEDRAKQAVFASYLDQMNTLLIEKGLRNAKPDSEVFVLAQARTATALRELDNDRRRLLLEFFIAANLNTPKDNQGLLVGTYLVGVNLSYANLSDANLSDVDLSDANLSSANFRFAILHSAKLRAASLSNANLSYANLSRADLRAADLSNANLDLADLSRANLSLADLSRANLNRANLSEAQLDGVFLCGTTLPDESLSNRDCE